MRSVARHWCFSGFANTDLNLLLKKHSIHQLIVRAHRAYLYRSDRRFCGRARLSRHNGEGCNGRLFEQGYACFTRGRISRTMPLLCSFSGASCGSGRGRFDAAQRPVRDTQNSTLLEPVRGQLGGAGITRKPRKVREKLRPLVAKWPEILGFPDRIAKITSADSRDFWTGYQGICWPISGKIIGQYQRNQQQPF